MKICSLPRIIAALIFSLLGLGSCKKDYPCMYGTPSADYEVGGIVKDEAGNPVKGIRAIVKYKRNVPEEMWNGDTLYTDDNGRYSRDLGSLFPGSCDDLKVIFEDIDGVENGGEFKSKTVAGQMKQVKKGDGSWYSGAFEVTADAVLEKKETHEN